VLWAGLTLVGCGWLDRLREDATPSRPEARYATHRGDGWAIQVPEGAKVRATEDSLSVDAPDGTWWFDVATVPAGTPFFAQIPATTWGEKTCLPLRLDVPAEPVDGLWTVSGTCAIEYGRYWYEVVLVPEGDRARLVAIFGRFGLVNYEDLWVHLWRTALTLRKGAEPADVPDPDVLRQIVRGTTFDDPRGLIPVPGGGVFSAEVARRIGARWRTWRDADVPTTFAPGSAAPSEPTTP